MNNRQRGVTFIELIVGIVLIGIMVSGFAKLSLTLTRSAIDPVVHQQAVNIAEAYMEEIFSKAFLDPTTGTQCPTPPAGGRAVYDNICDYDGLVDVGAEDQLGNPIAGLEDYTVSVEINPADQTALQSVPANKKMMIKVLVTYEYDTDNNFALDAHRLEY